MLISKCLIRRLEVLRDLHLLHLADYEVSSGKGISSICEFVRLCQQEFLDSALAL